MRTPKAPTRPMTLKPKPKPKQKETRILRNALKIMKKERKLMKMLAKS